LVWLEDDEIIDLHYSQETDDLMESAGAYELAFTWLVDSCMGGHDYRL
jgi:hypothetical protein